MSEYIKREDAIQTVKRYESIYRYNRSDFAIGRDDALETAARELADVPSADVVPVVRCKDCIFWDKRVTFQNYCTKHDIVSYPDDYCAWGRKEVEHE